VLGVPFLLFVGIIIYGIFSLEMKVVRECETGIFKINRTKGADYITECVGGRWVRLTGEYIR